MEPILAEFREIPKTQKKKNANAKPAAHYNVLGLKQSQKKYLQQRGGRKDHPILNESLDPSKQQEKKRRKLSWGNRPKRGKPHSLQGTEKLRNRAFQLVSRGSLRAYKRGKGGIKI